jgi:hypothetical protein
LAILLVAQPFAHAAIYVWHDPQGVTHYVDNLDNVPSEYRGGATLLVKDWERPALPPEPAAPAPDASAVASAATVDQVAASSFERGLWAGRESAMASLPAPPDVSLGPIVQNVQVFAPPEAPVIYGYPLFGPVFFPRFHSRRGLAGAGLLLSTLSQGRRIRRLSFACVDAAVSAVEKTTCTTPALTVLRAITPLFSITPSIAVLSLSTSASNC